MTYYEIENRNAKKRIKVTSTVLYVWNSEKHSAEVHLQKKVSYLI